MDAFTRRIVSVVMPRTVIAPVCTCKCVAIGTGLTREAVMTDGAEAGSRVHRPTGIRATWPVAAAGSSARSCPAPGSQRLAKWLGFTHLSRVVGSFH